MAIPHFKNLLISDGHLACFHFGAIINRAIMTICVQVFIWG